MSKIYQWLLLPGSLLLSSCLFQQQQNAEEQPADKKLGSPPQHLGAVHQVFPDQGFATLRFIGPIPAGGSTLVTHPPDGSNSRIGNLQLPSDLNVRGSYVVANIRSGTVFQGDRVFLYNNIAPSPSATNTTTPSGDSSQLGTPDPGSSPSPTTGSATTPTGSASTPTSWQPLPARQPEDITETKPTPPTRKPSSAVKTPDYLDEIPDNVNDWD